MGEITVQAATNVLGLKVGERETFEDTPFLRNVIKGGRLTLVESTCADTAASTTPAPSSTPERPAAKGKRAGAAEQPAEAELAEVVDVRPPADPDQILGDALVTLKPDPPEAA